MTAGRLVYLLYYKPIAAVRQSIREGGPTNQLVTWRGRRAMQKAVSELSPVTNARVASTASYEVHILTGARFWYQSAFSIWSLAAHSADIVLKPVFYDDGTLGSYKQKLERLFPTARFLTRSESKARMDRYLPKLKFPCLHDRWNLYPNIRKLIDPHLGLTGWKLVLDSDVLFFRRPDFLFNWIANPLRPLHMTDTEESYGYSRALLEKLTGTSVPRLLNVGICGLRSDSLDWDRIERWIQELTREAGTHYYLEQALVAMIVAGQECAIAPANDYITWPTPEEVAKPAAVMHHYVSLSKRDYFRRAWRECLTRMLR